MTATQTPPVKDNAQQMAAVAATNPGNVPAKFKNADGSVNVVALAEAYRQLERKQSQGGSASNEATAEQDAAAATTTETQQADPLAALETPPATTQQAAPSTFDEALSQTATATTTPPAVDWNKVTSELQTTGKLSDATVADLKAKGIPDALIQSAVNGFAAQQREQFSKAADLVGGKDKLQAIVQWVNKSFAADKKAQILSALRSPTGEQVLLGLAAQYANASGAGEGRQVDTSAGVGGGLGATPTIIQPFATAAEMEAAMNKREYQTDPEYQALVAARMYVTRGGDAKRAATILERARKR